MSDLTEFQRKLLYVLSGMDEPDGLAVEEELERCYGTDVHYERLYSNLDALADDGLVEKDRIDRHSHRYSLTHRGRRALRNRREWELTYADARHSAPE